MLSWSAMLGGGEIDDEWIEAAGSDIVCVIINFRSESEGVRGFLSLCKDPEI